MNMELLEFAQYVDYIRRARDQVPRRYLRDHSDPFRKYAPKDFFELYRLTPRTVKSFVVPLLAPHLKKSSRRGLPFAPEVMVLASLRYYATGSFQKFGQVVADICQQSMSRIIAMVSTILATKMETMVKFPSSLNEVKNKFYEIAAFPGVVGCLGCTHIKIKSPGGTTAESYRNKKGWFSINVQAVTGPNLDFFDLEVRWPGSSPDCYIFDNSCVKQRFCTGDIQGVLLGDNRYDANQFIMTPYLAPITSAHVNYNTSLMKTRDSINKAFGVWKQRFPCLQVGMSVKLSTAVAVICSCATLHNIAVMCNDNLILDEDTYEVDVYEFSPLQADDYTSDVYIEEREAILNFFASQSHSTNFTACENLINRME